MTKVSNTVADGVAAIRAAVIVLTLPPDQVDDMQAWLAASSEFPESGDIGLLDRPVNRETLRVYLAANLRHALAKLGEAT